MAESFALGNWGVTSEDILKNQFPMHRACRDGDVETLAILLSEGQHSVYEEDSFYGWTPAHWAAYFGKVKHRFTPCSCCNSLFMFRTISKQCGLTMRRLDWQVCHVFCKQTTTDCTGLPGATSCIIAPCHSSV